MRKLTSKILVTITTINDVVMVFCFYILVFCLFVFLWFIVPLQLGKLY